MKIKNRVGAVALLCMLSLSGCADTTVYDVATVSERKEVANNVVIEPDIITEKSIHNISAEDINYGFYCEDMFQNRYIIIEYVTNNKRKSAILGMTPNGSVSCIDGESKSYVISYPEERRDIVDVEISTKSGNYGYGFKRETNKGVISVSNMLSHSQLDKDTALKYVNQFLSNKFSSTPSAYSVFLSNISEAELVEAYQYTDTYKVNTISVYDYDDALYTCYTEFNRADNSCMEFHVGDYEPIDSYIGIANTEWCGIKLISDAMGIGSIRKEYSWEFTEIEDTVLISADNSSVDTYNGYRITKDVSDNYLKSAITEYGIRAEENILKYWEK